MASRATLPSVCCVFVTTLGFKLCLAMSCGPWKALAYINLVLAWTRLVAEVVHGAHAIVALSGWLGVCAMLVHALQAHSWANPAWSCSPQQLAAQHELVLSAFGHSWAALLVASWVISVDIGFSRQVVPVWATTLLSQLHALAVMGLHARVLPDKSDFAAMAKREVAMVLLPLALQLVSRGRARPGTAQQQRQCQHQTQLQHGDKLQASSSSCQPPLLAADSDVPAKCSYQPSPLINGSVAEAVVYKSILGPASLPVCIKLDTSHLVPAHLPRDAAWRLARAVGHASSSLDAELCVVGLSVRAGCILIGLQCVGLPGVGDRDTHGHLPSLLRSQQQQRQQQQQQQGEPGSPALQLAQQLLPGLLQQLGLVQDAAQVANLMGPGTSVSLQLGTQLVHAVYRPQAQEWSIQDVPLPASAITAWAGVGAPGGAAAGTAAAAGGAAAAAASGNAAAGTTAAAAGGAAAAAAGARVQPPQLGLVQQLAGRGSLRPAAPARSRSSRALAPGRSGGSSSGGDSCVSVVLQVPVVCAAGVGDLRVTGGVAGVGKWGDADLHGVLQGSSGHVAQHGAWAELDASQLQLYALLGEQHLPVVVLGQAPTATAPSSTVISLEVQVQLSGASLQRHHTPSGPVASVQPLHLQLWCGPLLLSAAHTLLNLAATTTLINDSHTVRTSGDQAGEEAFGWWGAPAALVTAAAAELQAETQRVLSSQLGGTYEAGQQALVQDVCLYLAGVRRCACSSGWCRAALTGSSQLGLAPPQLLALADSLAAFAGQRGLAALQRMVQQQRQIVVQAVPRTSVGLSPTAGLQAGSAASALLPPGIHTPALHAHGSRGSKGSVGSGSWAQQVRACVLGQPCPACEAHLQHALRLHLGPASACLSAFVATGAALILRREVAAQLWQSPATWLTAAWCLSHATMSALQLAPHHPRWRHRHIQVLGVLPWTLKALMCSLWALGWAPRLRAVQRQHQAGTWAVMQALNVLGDRLPLQAVLPAWAVSCAALVEAGVGLLLNRGHGWARNLASAAGIILLLPLLVTLHTRSRLRVR